MKFIQIPNKIENEENRKCLECIKKYNLLIQYNLFRRHTHKSRKYSLQENNEKGQRSPSIEVGQRKISIQPEDADLEVCVFVIIIFP